MYHPSVLDRAAIETTEHIWKTGDLFYKLAHRFYGNSSYWWIIAWYNGAPTEADLAPGDLLTVPMDLNTALSILGV